MSSTPIKIGTVIHGTLRPEDLAPAFFATLTAFVEPVWGGLLGDVQAIMDGTSDPDDTDDILAMMEDAINDALPEGWYFGAVEGDPTDFGIFPVEDAE
jgi:hypothetical protein